MIGSNARPRQRSANRPPAGGAGTFGAAHVNPGDAYAGVPILQNPVWNNEIAAYMYLGGISSGAFILGALADLSGERWRSLARTARVVSFAAMAPCAPLLIDDLGRPSRFHHMLRVFKPSSPMNLGSWTLLVHSGFSTLLAAHALAEADKLPVFGPLAKGLPSKLLGAAGILPAMTLGGYTGVLIGTTSVPLWSTSPMLGGLFMASAIASGTSAVSLASILSGRAAPADHAALGSIGLAAGASELCLAAGYLATSGEAAAPLREGADGALLLGALTATATALALEVAGKRGPSRQGLVSALAASASLAGGAMLRWAVIRAGRTSAGDRDANLAAMRPSSQNPGWGPPNATGSEA
ncbi:MAG TPA: NrfD/PsrC family molybdoenzyme membrane anchor subunit [Thermomicrobiales bacterium]|nr:NrfD/PsrC family molybdoenzyme membrane anchor subunit [Thermomicrobiales bacterium]